MLDASTALKTEERVVNVKKVVTDGPFVEGTDVVRGYVNLQTDTLDTASWGLPLGTSFQFGMGLTIVSPEQDGSWPHCGDP
jgi:hypothetical protein